MPDVAVLGTSPKLVDCPDVGACRVADRGKRSGDEPVPAELTLHRNVIVTLRVYLKPQRGRVGSRKGRGRWGRRGGRRRCGRSGGSRGSDRRVAGSGRGSCGSGRRAGNRIGRRGAGGLGRARGLAAVSHARKPALVMLEDDRSVIAGAAARSMDTRAAGQTRDEQAGQSGEDKREATKAVHDGLLEEPDNEVADIRQHRAARPVRLFPLRVNSLTRGAGRAPEQRWPRAL